MYSWSDLKLSNFGKKYFDFLLFFNKRKMLNSYNKAIEDLIKKIDIVKKTVLCCKKEDRNDMYEIWNIAGFILMASLDIKVINEKLLTEKGFGRKEFIMKSACVLIFEVLEDLEQILGREFYQRLSRLSISGVFIQELNKNKKEMTNLKRLHQNDLKKVRIIIGAHRDHDFLTQLETFNDLEHTSLLKLINDFEKKLIALSESIQNIINESVSNFTKINGK